MTGYLNIYLSGGQTRMRLNSKGKEAIVTSISWERELLGILWVAQRLCFCPYFFPPPPLFLPSPPPFSSSLLFNNY